MQYLNLDLSTLDSVEFVGSEPVDQATWLKLQRYCAGQENGGIIEHCRDWKDRKCQQLLRITRAELLRDCDLWTWEGDSLRLFAYPLAAEARVKQNRLAGSIGGQARTEAKAQASRRNGSQAKAQAEPKHHPSEAPSEDPTERKGRERKGSTTTPPPASVADASDPIPDSILATRLVDACPTPGHTAPALDAALDCLRRHPGRFDDILRATATATAAIRQWPEDERITYRPSAAKFFRDDLWLLPADQWASRREAKKRLTARGADPAGPALTADQLREKLGGRVAHMTDQEILSL